MATIVTAQQTRARAEIKRRKDKADRSERAQAEITRRAAPLPVPDPNVVDKTLGVVSKVTSAINPFARTFDLVNEQVQKRTEEGSFINDMFDSASAATGLAKIEVQSQIRGIAQMVGSLGNLVGIDDTKIQQALTDSEVRDRTIASNEIKEHPIASRVGQAVGIIGPAVVAGIGTLAVKAGLGVKSVIGAAEGAGFGAAQFTGEDGSKGGQALAGGLLGGAVPGAGVVLGKGVELGRKGVNFVKGLFNPAKAAQKEVIESGTQALQQPGARARVQAAEDAGTFVTPAEAAGQGGKVSAGREARLATNVQAQRQIEEVIITREATASGSFDDLVKSIVPEGEEQLAKNVDTLYKATLPKTLPDELVTALKNNDVIQEAIEQASRKPINKKALDVFPDNAVGRYDIAKKFLDDARQEALRAGKKNEARLLGEEIKSLTDSIDAVVPEYAIARSEAQRGIVLGNINDRMAGLKDKSVKSMFNEFLSTDAKIKEAFGSLPPESIELAKKVGTLLKSIESSQLPRNLARSTEKAIGRIADVEIQVSNFFRNFFIGRKNKEIFRLISDPRWVKQVDMINKMPTKQRLPALLALLELVGKAGPKTSQAIVLRDQSAKPQ